MSAGGLRRETSRALAKALAHKQAGNARAAEAAAVELVELLQGAGILSPAVTL